MTLTTKQQAFVEAYLANGFNGTRAAQSAGYTGSENTLAVIASENLRKPHIKQYVDERLNEFKMSADEVLVRLSEHARGDLGEFLGLEESEVRNHPKSWLVKRYKRTITRRGKSDDPIETETVEIELHDPQAALVHLGRYHKLFVDRVQSDDWRTEAIDLIRRGELTFDALAEAFDGDLATQLFREAGVTVQTRKG